MKFKPYDMRDNDESINLPGRRASRDLSTWGAFHKLVWLILLATAVTYVFHKIYYKIFPWILSKNVIYPAGTLTPWITVWNAERDGIEIYVLYAFMFLIIGVATALNAFFRLAHGKWIGGLGYAIVFLCAYKFLSVWRNEPPSAAVDSLDQLLLVYCILFGLAILSVLYLHNAYNKIIEALLIYCVLLPFCFIATSPIAMSNYVYIFSPAQKILEGVDIGQIYFQYDFLLSFIAAIWMKCGLELTQFQILGQLSYFGAIIGIFLIAKRLFQSQVISLLLLISLIVVRLASAPWDPVLVFQITPLRLDLWLILIAIIYFRGAYHWVLAGACGLLMLVHGNFGLLYTLGYLQLIATLSVMSMLDVGVKAKLREWRSLRNITRITATAGYLITCYLVSRYIFGVSLNATSYYQKIGIGFIPMAKASLFWFVPIVISFCFIMLCLLRSTLTPRYKAIGFALIYFVLGNCVYFFGRSHESNLFSISIPLVFILFYALDLMARAQIQWSPGTGVVGSRSAIVLGLSFVLIMSYKTSNEIRENVSLKLANVMAFQIHSGDPFGDAQKEADKLLEEIYGTIGTSKVIQFAGLDDNVEFALYQRIGGNTGYYYPFSSWIFVHELIAHEQALLDEGAYILVDVKMLETLLESRLRNIEFRYILSNGKYILIGNKSPVVSENKND